MEHRSGRKARSYLKAKAMSFVHIEPVHHTKEPNPVSIGVSWLPPETSTERHHREWAEGMAQRSNPTSTETEMNRSEILDAAKEIITKDRHDTHGAAEDSFTQIAGAWAWYLGRPLTAFDVAQMMVLFKMARMKHNPTLVDNAVDQVGYSALSGEIAQR